MVMARLHIICGNCGCNDMFKYNVDLKGADYGDHFGPAVYISCGNCATLHSLGSTIEEDETRSPWLTARELKEKVK